MIAKAIANWAARDASIPKRDDTMNSQALWKPFQAGCCVGCTTLAAEASRKVNRWLTALFVRRETGYRNDVPAIGRLRPFPLSYKEMWLVSGAAEVFSAAPWKGAPLARAAESALEVNQ
jgi:hypothetical protein